MITLNFRSADHLAWGEEFDTPQEAREHFLWFMGGTYDIGTHYAVNYYGDVTCTLSGATWKELGLGDDYE
jgi:hypothetical protein